MREGARKIEEYCGREMEIVHEGGKDKERGC